MANTNSTRLIAYARVSTQEQDTSLQVAAFKSLGASLIFEEKKSGAKASNRPVLKQCLDSLRSGDVFVFYKLDRVARSLTDLLRILDLVERAGASIRSLTEPIDTSTSAGRLMVQILGAMAEFERSLIRERSIAGQNQAKEKGIHCGRPASVAPGLAAEIVDSYSKGLFTLKGVGQKFGVSESVVKRLVYKKTKPHYKS